MSDRKTLRLQVPEPVARLGESSAFGRSFSPPACEEPRLEVDATEADMTRAFVGRPAFRGDEIVRAKLMNVGISCDHRVAGGWDTASHVHALKRCLERPILLFAPQDYSRQGGRA